MAASRLEPHDRPLPAPRAGFLAGAVALAVLLAGPPILGRPGFLEMVHNGATAYVPITVFEAALRIFGSAAKALLFAGVAMAVPIVGSILAVGLIHLVARFRAVPTGSARREAVGTPPPLELAPTGSAETPRVHDSRDPGLGFAVAAGLAAWLLGELLVLPVFGAGILGLGFAGDPIALQAPFAVACLAYGLVLAALLAPRRFSAPGAGEDPMAGPGAVGLRSGSPDPVALASRARLLGRRTFLARGATVLGWVALAGSGLVVFERLTTATRTIASPRPQAPGGFGPTPRITPVADFYVVAKDLLLPTIDAGSWRLQVGGLVDRPRSYRLADLRALPRVEGERTLTCISNEVVTWGGLAGNQRWSGVRLLDILAEVGVRPEATHVLWRCADGYTESLPLAEVDDGVWLVDEMGPPGTALTPEHGAPLRVLVAGRYGMKQPKWLTEIVLADRDEPGYWVRRGWDAEAVVRTWSRIDEPRSGDGVPVGRPFEVFGVAFAGRRGIRRVEVSADDGRSWRAAEIEEPPSAGDASTWRRWRVRVELEAAGGAVLVVRAIDGLGRAQEGEVRPPLPAGATGYHRVPVVALEGD